AVILVEVEEGDDVRVAQGGGDARLGEEAAHRAAQVRVEELDRDLAVEVDVVGTVDRAGSSSAELGDEAVAGAHGGGLTVDAGDGDGRCRRRRGAPAQGGGGG